ITLSRGWRFACAPCDESALAGTSASAHQSGDRLGDVRASIRPHPVLDVRRIFEMLSRVIDSRVDARLALGDQSRRAITQSWHPADRQHREVIPADLVQYHHIERRRRRALLVEAADVEPLRVT